MNSVPERPVGDDDGVVELAEGVGARGRDAVVADARVAPVQVVEPQLVRVVQQDLQQIGSVLACDSLSMYHYKVTHIVGKNLLLT